MTEHATTTLDPSLAAARDLAPLLSDRALVTERLGTLPPDLVAEARRAGLFRLALPRALGGAELEPATIVEVLEETCRADSSAGWTIALGNCTAFLAWLEPGTATELIGDNPEVTSACAFAPTGRLTPATGFRLDGKWSFLSGCLHADLFICGALVMDGEQPRMVDQRGPDWRLAVFPAADGSVIENWDVAGLRGTGSHDVAATGLAVPAEHTMASFFEPARHGGPLWRFPFFTLVGTLLVSFPLGVARRALDEFAALAPTKIRPPGPASIAEEGDVQVALAQAEGGLQSARAFVFDTLGTLWDNRPRRRRAGYRAAGPLPAGHPAGHARRDHRGGHGIPLLRRRRHPRRAPNAALLPRPARGRPAHLLLPQLSQAVCQGPPGPRPADLHVLAR